MKVEFLRDPDAFEIADPESLDRLKIVAAWVAASVMMTIFICSRRPTRVLVASSKHS
jgi:hypothetical protein